MTLIFEQHVSSAVTVVQVSGTPLFSPKPPVAPVTVSSASSNKAQDASAAPNGPGMLHSAAMQHDVLMG